MKIISFISNIGLNESDSQDYVRKVHLINRSGLLSTIVSLVFVGQLYLVHQWYYWPFQLATGILGSLFILFSLKRYFYLSFLWTFSTILINVFYCSLEIQGSGVEFFLIPLSLLPYTVFENKLHSLILNVLAFAAFTLSYFIKDNYVAHLTISAYHNQVAFVTVFIAVFVLCAIIIFQFKVINLRYEAIISNQKKNLEIKNKDITDSINYAKRIQQAKLPKIEEIEKALPNSFILFKPKDIVSGDFYAYYQKEHKTIIAAADCTGHGVPGAIMSMIGSERLDDAILHTSDTSEILSLLNKGVKKSLKQSDHVESTRDGMDIAICSIDLEQGLLSYAGANRPIWIVRKNGNELQEVKATRKAIGGLTDDHQQFETHEIPFVSGDTFYICSDGYADTFSQNNKKLTTKKFKEIILSIQHKTMHEQGIYLNEFLENWKVNTEQVDDILVVGFRL